MTANQTINADVPLEDWLDLELDKFHPSWRDSWGTTIKSAELREAILETTRLETQIRNQVLQTALDFIRSFQRSSNEVPFNDVKAISRFRELASNKLIKQAGLIWYAKRIRNLLNGDDAHNLVNVLGQETIKSALRNQDKAPDIDTDFSIQDLKRLIEIDGLKCCYYWIQRNPDHIAARLAVLLPKPDNIAPATDEIQQKMTDAVDLALASF